MGLEFYPTVSLSSLLATKQRFSLQRTYSRWPLVEVSDIIDISIYRDIPSLNIDRRYVFVISITNDTPPPTPLLGGPLTAAKIVRFVSALR